MVEFFQMVAQYEFISRALIVGVLVSLCASLLGVSLVLKQYSMIGDGLSHVGFGALAAATAMQAAPLQVAIPVVIAAAFLLLRLNESTRIKGDAAIAVLSSAFLAIGVLVISFSSGSNIDVVNYMFGSIVALSKSDLILSIALSAVVLVLFLVFYHNLFAVTFDETFAKATGIRAGVYNSVLAVLTALTIVLGMRMMGAMLISSLIVFPALTSMRLCKSFRSVTLCAAVLSVVCFLVGFYLSCISPKGLPTGATIVVVNVAMLLIFSLIRACRNGLGKKQ